MNTLDLGRASQDQELRDHELGAVSGGNEVSRPPSGGQHQRVRFEPVGLGRRCRPSTGTGRTPLLTRGTRHPPPALVRRTQVSMPLCVFVLWVCAKPRLALAASRGFRQGNGRGHDDAQRIPRTAEE